MPEDGVGGISVSFTAEASQLQAELQRLEQQLTSFNKTYGKQTVRLTAQVQMPSTRHLQDVRRDLSKAFAPQGTAGPVKVPISLLVPNRTAVANFARDLRTQVGDVRVNVKGHWAGWSNPPPTSITVSGGGGGGGRGGAPPSVAAIRQSPAQAVAAQSLHQMMGAGGVSRVPKFKHEFYRDWSNAQILEDYVYGGGTQHYRNRAQEEMRHRGIIVPAMSQGGIAPAGRPSARGLTGGATGAYGTGLRPVPHYSTTGIRNPQAAEVAAMGRAGQISLPASSIYNPYSRESGGRPATAGAIARAGLTEPQMVRNLERILSRATPESTAAGMGWYQRAGRLTQSMALGSGVGRTQAAAATAVFSSQAAWEKNVRNAQNFFAALSSGAKSLAEVMPFMARAGKDVPTKENVQKALDVAFAPNEQAIEQRLSFSRKGSKGGDNPKVRSFWRALMGDPNAAVIDRHQAMMMSGGQFENPVNQAGAQPFQNALRTAARRRGISAADTQAISWATLLGHEVAGADPHGQLAGLPGARGFASGDPYARSQRMEARQRLDLANAARVGYGVPQLQRFTSLSRGVSPERALIQRIEEREREQAGARGYTGPQLTWQERLQQMRPRALDQPLQLSSRGRFARGINEVPVEQVSPRALLPFRELDREQSPRLQPRTFQSVGASAQYGKDYLDRLTKEIGQGGVKEPLRLEYDEEGLAQLADGNHRLAAAIRLGLNKVPVQAFPATGPLTGNAGRVATVGATTAAGIIGARGFMGGNIGRLTGTPYPPSHMAMYGEGGYASQGAAEYAARDRALGEVDPYRRMRATLQPKWGGFTMDPRTGQFMQQEPGRARGPFVSHMPGAQTEKLPLEASEEQVRAGMARLMANPANRSALERGAQVGGFRDEDLQQIHLDLVKVDQTTKQARSTQRELGPEARGAYDVATGKGVFALSPAQTAQRSAAGRASYARAMAEGRIGAGGRITGTATRRPIAQVIPQAMAAELGTESEAYTPPFSVDPNDMYDLTMREPGDPRREAAEGRYAQFGAKGRRRPQAKVYPGGIQPSGRAVRKVSIDERQSIIGGSEELQQGVAARQGFEERLIAARQATTVRSPGTFLAGLFSNLTGGARARELGTQASRAITEMRGAEERLVGAYGKEVDIQKALRAEQDPSRQRQIRSELNTQYEVVEKLSHEYGDAYQNADKLSTAAQKAAGGGVRNLAAGFAGGLVGGLAFGAGMSALQGVIEGVSQAMAPSIARMTNYGEAAGEVSKNLADVVRQQHGLAEPALAQVFAQTGFKGPSAEEVAPTLLRQAQISAGLSAFQEQQALLQGAFNFRNATGVPGITSSIGGGLFGIGAQKSIFETIKEGLQGIPAEVPAGAVRSGRAAAFGPVGGGTAADINERRTKQIELISQTLETIGLQVKRTADAGASTAESTAQYAAIAKTPSAEVPGGTQASVLADTLKRLGLVITDLNGDLPPDIQAAVEAGLVDAPKPSVKALIDAQRPVIEAQKLLFRQQAKDQRDIFLPAAFALQQASQPLTRQDSFGAAPRNALTGRAIPIPALFRSQFGQSGGAVGAQFSGALESLSPIIDEADSRLMDLRKDGQAALEALVPQDQITEFRALNKEIAGVGAQIAGIQLGVQQEQVNLQVAQYNDQLRIATRSQTDLLQLTGQIGATGGDNLGLLQRQQIMYERQTAQLQLQTQELQLQSNALSIMMAQRQINFQRSIAGFVTPGETPQEIAARAREAELEANYAQKQLDIQKEQQRIAREQQGISQQAVPLSFEIQDIGFQRQLTDITAQIGLLNQGIQLTVHTAAADRAIAHLSALENELVKRAATYVEEGSKVVQAVTQTMFELKAQTEEGFRTVLAQTQRAWNVFLVQGRLAVGGLTGGPVVSTPTSNNPVYQDPDATFGGVQRAAGFYGMISSASRITVGEAGPETVAIIRNPRNFTAPKSGDWGGGGGGGVSVLVTGNQIGGDRENLEEFATIIARKVEEIQSRRGSLLGLRSQ